MKIIWVIYRRPAPKEPYAPVVFNGTLLAFDDYDAAFSACDIDNEIIVKCRAIMPVMGDRSARRITLKQYATLNKK